MRRFANVLKLGCGDLLIIPLDEGAGFRVERRSAGGWDVTSLRNGETVAFASLRDAKNAIHNGLRELYY